MADSTVSSSEPVPPSEPVAVPYEKVVPPNEPPPSNSSDTTTISPNESAPPSNGSQSAPPSNGPQSASASNGPQSASVSNSYQLSNSSQSAPSSNSSHTTTTIPPYTDTEVKDYAMNAINIYKNDTYLPWRINIKDELRDSIAGLVVSLYKSAINNTNFLNVLGSFFNVDVSALEFPHTRSNIEETLTGNGATSESNFSECLLLLSRAGTQRIFNNLHSFENMLVAIPLLWTGFPKYNFYPKYAITYTAQSIIKYLANFKYLVNMLREIRRFTNSPTVTPVNGFNEDIWRYLVQFSTLRTFNDNDYTDILTAFSGYYFNSSETVGDEYFGPVPKSSTVTIPKNYIPDMYGKKIPNLQVDPNTEIQPDGFINATLSVAPGSRIMEDGTINLSKDLCIAIQDTVPSRLRIHGSVVLDDGRIMDVSNNIIILDPSKSNEAYKVELQHAAPGAIVIDDGSIFLIQRSTTDLFSTLSIPPVQAGGKKKRKTIKGKKGKKSKKSKKNRRGKSLKYMV